MNLDKDQIRVKNKVLAEEIDKVLLHRDVFQSRSELINRFLINLYDEKLDKLFNMTVILENDFNSLLGKNSKEDFANFLVI